MSVYEVVKGRAYGLAQIVTGRSNQEAIQEGFRDVFDLLMSDSDNARQQQFLIQLPSHFTEGHRQFFWMVLQKSMPVWRAGLPMSIRSVQSKPKEDARRVRLSPPHSDDFAAPRLYS